MNLLTEWRRKESWKRTFPFCPVYVSMETGEKDLLLLNLLKNEVTLTLDLSETGFQEIGVDWVNQEVPEDHRCLMRSVPKMNGLSSKEFAEELVQRATRYLAELWDSSKFHLVLVSGGLDSRIVSYMIASLRDQKGEEWLGRVHFRCEGPESFMFEQVMKRQKWKENQYSIYKKGRFFEEGYFEKLYDFEDSVNGFHRSPLDFFHDLNLDYKNTQIVYGNLGGELLDNPFYLEYTSKDLADLFPRLKRVMEGTKFNYSHAYAKWGDILCPFQSYEFMDLAFRIPDHFLTRSVEVPVYDTEGAVKTQKIGAMRKEIVDLFEDDLPCCRGHSYNLSASEKKKALVKDSWLKSKFYKDFKKISAVSNVGKNLCVHGSIENKLYGLATSYEKI